MEVIELKVGNASDLSSEVVIRVLAIRGNVVQLGFEASRELRIVRSELLLLPEKRKIHQNKGHGRKK